MRNAHILLLAGCLVGSFFPGCTCHKDETVVKEPEPANTVVVQQPAAPANTVVVPAAAPTGTTSTTTSTTTTK